MSKATLETLGNELESTLGTVNDVPPVDSWNPPFSGNIDMAIKHDGTWYHEGSPINRHALVKLFASILKRENDEYFLVTPVEKWRLQVEDVPFIAVKMSVDKASDSEDLAGSETNNRQALSFETNVGDCVTAGPNHTLSMNPDRKTGELAPYILVRGNLFARLSHPIYYQLTDLAYQDAEGDYVVESCGVNFTLA